MKYILILSFVLFASFSFEKKCGDDDVVHVENVCMKSLDSLGNALNNEIIKKDKSLNRFQPTVAIAKNIAPQQTENLSDEDIQAKLLQPMFERLETNLNNIQESLDKHNLSSSDTKLKEVKHYPEDRMANLEVGSLELTNNGFGASIPFTFYMKDGKIYLFEILNSVGVFKEH